MNDKQSLRAIEILLVEDNPGDERLTREALKDSKICNNLHVVQEGTAVADFLHKRGDYQSAPRPDLILLDWNLPGKAGHEVLLEIKSDSNFRTIPVVILTTSAAEEDILKAYHLHANCYIRKPVGFAQFVEVVKFIEHFWLSIVTLPSH